MAGRRLALLRASRVHGRELLRLDPEGLPFHAGGSPADLRIPVHVSEEVTAVVRDAAAEVAMLVAVHHRRFLPPAAVDRILAREEYGSLPVTVDALGPVHGGGDLRAAARLALAAHPALHGGLVTTWLGPQGKGRALSALWTGATANAIAGGAPGGGREVAVVVSLALFDALARAAGELAPYLPAPPHDRWVRAAAVTALWVAAQSGLQRAARDASLAAADPLRMRLEALLDPGTLLGARTLPPGAGSTLYGVDLGAGVPRVADHVAGLAAGGDPEALVAELAADLAAAPEWSARAELAVATQRLRELLGAAVIFAEGAGRRGGAADARALLALPAPFTAMVHDEYGRRQLATRCQQSLGSSVSGESAAALDLALRGLRAWDPRSPAAALGISRVEARQAYATAAAALIADGVLEAVAAPARRSVVVYDGSAEEAAAGWEEGRLYRVSARPGPVLAPSRSRQRGVAHLFVDVKDFTRRTGLLGPAAMGEFLRREFYLPILAAARERVAAVEAPGGPGGVAVNNLLGDALSLSGDVEALVEIAAEIRRLLAGCEARLAGEVPGDGVGAALEAGVFVSFGPAPLGISVDDPHFGPRRVAIAEKINESARGTARAPAARARADHQLEVARRARGRPGLRHAWSVFIGPPLALPLPAAVEEEALRAVRAGDVEAALRAVAGPVRQALEAAAEADAAGTGDVYNAGAALSEEAMDAFLSAVAGARTVRRVELHPGDVPPALADRYWYGSGTERLVVAFHRDGRAAEMFRWVGRARFKGLGDVPVWELASGQGGPEALFQAMRERWLGAPGGAP